jgi:hypothetical protein
MPCTLLGIHAVLDCGLSPRTTGCGSRASSSTDDDNHLTDDGNDVASHGPPGGGEAKTSLEKRDDAGRGITDRGEARNLGLWVGAAGIWPVTELRVRGMVLAAPKNKESCGGLEGWSGAAEDQRRPQFAEVGR